MARRSEDYEYTVVPSIASDGIHTDESPFCSDASCPCHEDQDAIGNLYQHWQDGEVSDQDRDNIYHGRGRICNL